MHHSLQRESDGHIVHLRPGDRIPGEMIGPTLRSLFHNR